MENNKLIIKFFGQKHVPSREGGVEIVVEELAVRMSAAGHDITCINRRSHHVSGKQYDLHDLKEYKNIKIISVPTIEKKGLAAASAALFSSVIVAFGKCDIVHIHAEGSAAFCWFPKLFGKKVIVTCHGLDWKRPKWQDSFGGKFIKYGEKTAVKYADEIIVLNNHLQTYFMDVYGRKTTIIPNGIEKFSKKKANLIIEKWGLNESSYILALSRLTEEKRIHLLIKAFKDIATEKKLIIAGGSSDSKEYVKLLHESAAEDERIIFTDFVQGQLLEELYSNAYIYCLPSELEGMPLSLLEAMSYGNCCLVSDIAECRDVVEDKAELFEANNVESLKRKLEFLINNPDIVNEYRQNAAEFICGKYNWDDVVEKTIALYKKVK